MRHKLSANDEGIFDSPHAGLFEDTLDDTTPLSRKSLIDQAFLTNAGLGDPTLEASPAAVNPSLTGNLGNARVDPLSGPASTSDEMGGGMGERGVFASYELGRRDALAKFAFQSATGSHLPATASRSRSPRTMQPVASAPAAPSASAQLRDSQAALGTSLARNHAQDFGTDIRTPVGAPEGAGINSASMFKATTGPSSTAEGAQKQATESLPVRSDYGVRKPTRYSIPADNGAGYSPKTNLGDKNPRREVSKGFTDLSGQRNADTLNEAGQASIGVIG